MKNLADMLFDLFGPLFNKELRRDMGRMIGQGRPKQPIFEGLDYLPDSSSRWSAFFAILVGAVYFASSVKDKGDYIRLFKFIGLPQSTAERAVQMLISPTLDKEGGVYNLRGGPTLARAALIFRSYWNPIKSSLGSLTKRGVQTATPALATVGAIGTAGEVADFVSGDPVGDDGYREGDEPSMIGKAADFVGEVTGAKPIADTLLDWLTPDEKEDKITKPRPGSLPFMANGQLETDEPVAREPETGIHRLRRPEIDLEDGSTAAVAVELEDLGRVLLSALAISNDERNAHEFERRIQAFVGRGDNVDPSFATMEDSALVDSLSTGSDRLGRDTISQSVNNRMSTTDAFRRFVIPDKEGFFGGEWLNPKALWDNLTKGRSE